MFSRSIQPDVVSLFSSTGSDPLGLFSLHVDRSLPSDSFIHLLHDSTSLPAPPPPATLITAPSVYRDQCAEVSQGHQLNQTVLHIQSPTLRKTFIQCPPSAPLHTSPAGSSNGALGLKHPWLRIQVRNLGRDWSFEVGIVDKSDRHGIIRCSTFQKSPQLVRNHGAPAVLHLPLAFPPSSSSPLTSWSTIALHLPTYIPHFASLAALLPPDTAGVGGEHQIPLPCGTYAHLTFIKIYATCRLRRIWLSESAPITGTPWECELYGDEVVAR